MKRKFIKAQELILQAVELGPIRTPDIFSITAQFNISEPTTIEAYTELRNQGKVKAFKTGWGKTNKWYWTKVSEQKEQNEV